ncbi:hypothetical protein [Burkholderia vietnamiensis]|uniref:Uncharacterized protein n=1 Tax=Burkholderia vietnamiensis TaxID=60552 RepID=A0AAW7TET2_BURVI|nr:hypothetical protein [Burkholderia vietnamiensis]MDN7800040.1 hypothetical protein [Burkholderia vietnamiensis]
MNKSDEIVFAPSIDWAKRKAKLLRRRIGPNLITHTAVLDLLAKMYGFRNWLDYLDFKASDLAFETGWDSELLEKTFDERRYLQSSTLMTELGLTEGEAALVLGDVDISGKPAASKRKAADLEAGPEPCFMTFSRDEQPSATSHPASQRATQRPTITYKRPRLIVEQTSAEEA